MALFNELALFAGIGGGILGGKLLGWKTVCAVEIEPYCREVLLRRQRDGLLPLFPIWDDAKTFDGKLWRGKVDLISAGVPCQDISIAGKGEGITGERSGLWGEMARIIGEVRPQFAWVENSPMLVGRGLARVLGDLAEMGYDAKWGIVGACHVAAPHKRDRIWILAYANELHDDISRYGTSEICRERSQKADISRSEKDVANVNSARKLQQKGIKQKQWGRLSDSTKKNANIVRKGLQISRSLKVREDGRKARRVSPAGDWWATEPGMVRMVHGAPNRIQRIKALGNGQVPLCAAHAFQILAGGK